MVNENRSKFNCKHIECNMDGSYCKVGHGGFFGHCEGICNYWEPKKTMGQGKMYTVKEVAQELNLTTYTVRNYIKKGLIKATKYINTNKGSWYISESEILRFKGEV